MGPPARRQWRPRTLRTAAFLVLPLVLRCDSLVNVSLPALVQKLCENQPVLQNLTGPSCRATTDQIGTCWPRSSAGDLVARPCPEFVNGVKYNTTRE
ncbi:corticotropin-releasing factor receptor 1-like [Crotalus tigris]|uniref:corticotropin-releasing factor receptor 1-like n=1 Tax=Crotalus tigris TaxID=88082 RepID=UPI00192F9151|nr:corticotropin-releasing factor receptor 1-like [Crotalus tigris]